MSEQMIQAQDMFGGGPPIAIENEDVNFEQYHFDNADDVIDVDNDGEDDQQRAGRKVSNMYDHFTNDPAPHKLKSAICKHCRIRFNHHKKGEQAMRHLLACSDFRHSMNGIEIDDRPEWYSPNKKRAKPSKSVASSTLSSQTQGSITNYLLPKLDAYSKSKFEQAIAMHYYITGTSFQRIEVENLTTALKVLRPDVVLPTRKKLSGPLLNKAYLDLKKKTDANLGNATFCLTSDAWSNVKNEPIVNYMATSPLTTLFLESVSTGEQGHNADWIASDIERVMAAHPKTTFAGAVTDNTSTNRNAWEQLAKAHPSAYFQGCTSHGLHLLVKDIFAATKTKKSGSLEYTYPTGYPFEYLLEFIVACKDIVKLFHNSHVLKAQLQAEQNKANVRKLVRMTPTSWGTIKGCCETLLSSERILHAVVTARDFIRGTPAQKTKCTRIKEVVKSEDFVYLLEKSLRILAPIDTLIVKYQSDAIPVSEVMPDFHALPTHFTQLIKDRHVSVEEGDYMINLTTRRFQFMYGKAHGLAYLFDPRFVGQGLDTANRSELENILISTPVDDQTPVDDCRRERLYIQLTAYIISARQEMIAGSFWFQMLMKGRKTPSQYWLTDGAEWPDLQNICAKLFSLATSSAASERNFSAMGFIHSKLRNCLALASVEKLVYIKSNYRVFAQCDYTSDLSDFGCSDDDRE